MTTIDADEVLTRDRTSGRIHKRYRVPGMVELVTAEGDNLDDSGEYDVIESTEGAEPEALCARCFPAIEGAPV